MGEGGSGGGREWGKEEVGEGGSGGRERMGEGGRPYSTKLIIARKCTFSQSGSLFLIKGNTK